MKVFLLYKNRNFNLQVKLPLNEKDLIQDLGLNALFDAMAMGDEFLFEVAKKIVLTSENDLDTILYRQDILRDCPADNQCIIRKAHQDFCCYSFILICS